MRTPRFSVIIPTLNEEKFLPHLLTSLTEQTKKDFEVIVVDGKSKDKTVAVARSFEGKLPHLTVLVSKKASLPLQRNLGAAAARGEWFVFIDADGVLMPYFIERIGQYIADQHPAVFSTWAQPDSDVNNDAIFTLLANIFWESMVVWKRPAAPGPLTVVRNDIFRDVGGYDERHAFNEDVDLGLRLAKRGFTLTMVRESLYIWSMRRFRKHGTLRVIEQLALSSIPIFILKRPLKSLPGYVMGGQLYRKKKKINRSALIQYERKLKALVKELFA